MALARCVVAAVVAFLLRPSCAGLRGNRALSDVEAATGSGVELFGHRYYASTTIYGDTPRSSCGELDTRELVNGTEYFAVASAQAMQDEFPLELHGGGCGWTCKNGDGSPVDRCLYDHPNGTLSGSVPRDGCSCVQEGSCMCGKAGNRTDDDDDTAQMGCFTCGRGHFLRKTPYGMNDPDAHVILGGEIRVVVADVCPYGPNYKWCPGVPGEVNTAGTKNHLDFATRPKFRYDNNFFVFTPEPCSELLIERMRNMTTCPDSSWPDA
mmetsp:Transcript_10333/g.29431  ORF Transcript_10333/g.29431 Transcript_10333/m.29431 type:complete len:266 (-) Transcript_10333:132-929(-)